jgi:hypothetical protein
MARQWRCHRAASQTHRELHRIQTVEDFVFLSKQEAEAFALKLCKAWIDRAALNKTIHRIHSDAIGVDGD